MPEQKLDLRQSRELRRFNKAMKVILRANPQEVKAEMGAEARANAEERAAKGERKRGRKASTSDRASDATGG